MIKVLFWGFTFAAILGCSLSNSPCGSHLNEKIIEETWDISYLTNCDTSPVNPCRSYDALFSVPYLLKDYKDLKNIFILNELNYYKGRDISKDKFFFIEDSLKNDYSVHRIDFYYELKPIKVNYKFAGAKQVPIWENLGSENQILKDDSVNVYIVLSVQ